MMVSSCLKLDILDIQKSEVNLQKQLIKNSSVDLQTKSFLNTQFLVCINPSLFGPEYNHKENSLFHKSSKSHYIGQTYVCYNVFILSRSFGLAMYTVFQYKNDSNQIVKWQQIL